MKLTRLFAASLAALSVVSCSNEIIEDAKNGVELNPGDALVELNLSRGITSYATDTQEKELKNLIYKLYKPGGDSIKTTPTGKGSATKISFTIAAADMAGVTQADLYIAGNTVGFTTDGTATIAFPLSSGDADLLNIQGALTDNAAALTKGLPASAIHALTLRAGVIQAPATGVKRVASRLHVVSTTGNTADLQGYTIKYTGHKLANLFDPKPTVAAADAPALTYTVKGNVSTADSKTEPVGYLYPTKNAKLEITAGTTTKEVTISEVVRNKNYAIKITPLKTPEGSLDFDVSVGDWEDDGPSTDIDFNTTYAGFDFSPVDHPHLKVLAEKNGVAIKSGHTGEIDFADILKYDNANSITEVKVVGTKSATAENPISVAVKAGSNSTVTVATLPNYSGDEVKQQVVVKFQKADKSIYEETVQFYLLDPKPSIEAVLIDMAGTKWMPFNTSGSITTDAMIADSIVKMAGANNAEKTVNYAYASQNNYANVQGVFHLGSSALQKCPEGYKSAVLADYNELAGGNAVVPKRPGSDPKWGVLATQEFTNSTLNQVTKANPYANALGYYFEFVLKAGGTKLPFIGTSSSGAVNTNTVVVPASVNLGFAMFTGETRAGGTDVERVAFWNDGIANNAAVGTVTSNVRCVKK